MFLVSSDHNNRKARIRSFLTPEEAGIAVLLSACHFEWTVGRFILLCGSSAVNDVRSNLESTHGLDQYKELWKSEISSHSANQIKPLAEEIRNWREFRDAFSLRHKLIHGRESCSKNHAEPKVEIILKAIDDLYQIASDFNIDLHQHLNRNNWKKRTKRHS